MLTIAIFLLTSRRCCKHKKQDPESAILKERLVTEQRRMSKCQLKFAMSDHPVFRSILQQEDNDIAEEVKESYKQISSNVHDSIICCPDIKQSYIYNPQKLSSAQNVTNIVFDYISKSTKSIQEALKSNGDNCLVDRTSNADLDFDKDYVKEPSLVNSFSCAKSFSKSSKVNNKQIKSEEHVILDNFIAKTLAPCLEETLKRAEGEIVVEERLKSGGKRHKNFLTKSEIHKIDDLKSLLFNKWIEETAESKNVENSEIGTLYTEHDLSYDDVESILTSISRMDSCRIQRLKESTFYQKLLSQMDPIPGEDEVSNESIDPVALDEIINSKLGSRNNLNLTHDELMQVVIDGEDSKVATEQMKATSNKQDIDDNIIAEDHLAGKIVVNKTSLIEGNIKESLYSKKDKDEIEDINYINDKNHNNKQMDANSESLFKIIRSLKTPDYGDLSYNNQLDESTLTLSYVSDLSKELVELEESDISDFETRSEMTGTSKTSVYDFSGYESSNTTESSRDISINTSYASRPSSLALKRKHTDLFSSDDEDKDGTENVNSSKMENKYYIDSSYTSSSSSRLPSITTWQEIYESKKRDDQHQSFSHFSSMSASQLSSTNTFRSNKELLQYKERMRNSSDKERMSHFDKEIIKKSEGTSFSEKERIRYHDKEKTRNSNKERKRNSDKENLRNSEDLSSIKNKKRARINFHKIDKVKKTDKKQDRTSPYHVSSSQFTNKTNSVRSNTSLTSSTISAKQYHAKVKHSKKRNAIWK